MVMTLAPGVASAQTAVPDARSTDAVCEQLNEYNRDRFTDTRGSAHERNILCMEDYGLTEGLRGGNEYGPRLDVTRGQMASFIARFIEDYQNESLPRGNQNRFRDVDSTYVHSNNINSLAAIDVVEGTNRSGGQEYAPNQRVTRAQMASFIRRALSYLDNCQVNPLSEPAPATDDYFPDDDGSVHERNINAIADVGIVQGFDDGDYRPNHNVKRDQMSSFVMRAYDYAETENLSCDEDPGTTDPDPVATELTGVTVDTDAADLEGEHGTASLGDVWTVDFSSAVDMSDTPTFTVETDTGAWTIDCDAVANPADTTTVAADCEFNEDGTSVTVELLEDVIHEVGDENAVAYDDLTVTDTNLVDDEGEDVEVDDVEFDTTGAEEEPRPIVTP